LRSTIGEDEVGESRELRWLLDCVDWGLVREYFGELRVLDLNDGAVVVLRREAPS
jgi:hypothetical protein